MGMGAKGPSSSEKRKAEQAERRANMQAKKIAEKENKEKQIEGARKRALGASQGSNTLHEGTSYLGVK